MIVHDSCSVYAVKQGVRGNYTIQKHLLTHLQFELDLDKNNYVYFYFNQICDFFRLPCVAEIIGLCYCVVLVLTDTNIMLQA